MAVVAVAGAAGSTASIIIAGKIGTEGIRGGRHDDRVVRGEHSNNKIKIQKGIFRVIQDADLYLPACLLACLSLSLLT